MNLYKISFMSSWIISETMPVMTSLLYPVSRKQKSQWAILDIIT